jgi:hypothetical protein
MTLALSQNWGMNREETIHKDIGFRFAPVGPPMYTEDYAQSLLLSPRVGRPIQNHAVSKAGSWTDRSHLAAVRPEMPALDRRHVRAIRTVHGQVNQFSALGCTYRCPGAARYIRTRL